MQNQPTKEYNIPAEATLEVIGGKWKLLILCYLSCGPMRSSEFRKEIPCISQKILTQHLREMEQSGIINRTVYNELPLKVVYEMSELGKSLKSILDQLCDWGEYYINARKS
ncbi:winged helix-turn-helix transcriptional regulator [Cohnella abietis]|uniref:Putative HTH-type transcriptional regulator YtcD n=1 Tax=Cohnella abietis TaxID=2507935 RepID=A0A3T1D5D4_9BACL|nr:helix-turn-helix domain-containing protein [Cohnella abietis]BBI33314.1 putative HTH-type transcriptional regulator YtcD [Cohnella abietis]